MPSNMAQSSQDKNTTTDSSSSTVPWKPQRDLLKKTIFPDAKTAYGEAQGATTPDGFVAQLTPDQLSVFQNMIDSGGIGAAGSQLSQAGAAASADALNALGGFTPKGGTDYNIHAAGKYADNQYIGGAVDAAMRDARRQVGEQALPQLARDSAGTGNVNSNRRAISEGILERGLADRAADISSTMRSNAYTQGLDLAQREVDANNASTLQAMLGRAQGGTAAATAGANAASSLYDLAGRGVSGQLAGAQAGLDDQTARYGFETSSPFDALKQLYGIVGDKSWGSNTQSTGTSLVNQTNNPSQLDTIGKSVSTIGTIGSWFASDRNVKKDILAIGETYDGQTIYRFRYKDDPETVHIGLLAQDVEKINPSAVRLVNGVKQVNYDLATHSSAIH